MASVQRENKQPRVLTQKELSELPDAIRKMYGSRGHLLKQYRPCNRCHKQSKAKSSAYCTECGKKVRNAWAAKNREYSREIHRNNWEIHADEINEKRRKKYWENPEEARLKEKKRHLSRSLRKND